MDGQVARGTVGLRIPIDRFTLKVTMSQDKDKDPVSVQRAIDTLGSAGPYRHDALAADRERARAEGFGYE